MQTKAASTGIPAGGEGVIVIIADVDEVAALLGLLTGRHPTISPTQTHGSCTYYSGEAAYPDGDGPGPEPREGGDPCQYPGEVCLHLNNHDVHCPVKDNLDMMCKVSILRAECEAEQEEQEQEIESIEVPRPEYVLSPLAADLLGLSGTGEPAPKPRAPRADAWIPGEEEIVRTGENPTDAVKRYREAFPDATRTAAAIQARWYAIRQRGSTSVPEPEPEDADLPTHEHPKYPVYTRVRVNLPSSPAHGEVGHLVSHRPVTGEYLVSLDNLPDAIWISEANLVPLDEGGQ